MTNSMDNGVDLNQGVSKPEFTLYWYLYRHVFIRLKTFRLLLYDHTKCHQIDFVL